MIPLARYMLLGAPVDAVDIETAFGCVEEHLAAGRRRGCVLSLKPEMVFAARSSRFLRGLFRSAVLVLPDGSGMALALRVLLGARVPPTRAVDMMRRVCAAAPERGYRVFVYGATEPVNRAAVAALLQRYPGIRIAGRAHGYTRPDRMQSLIEEINAAKVDVLFVDLGSPRQEHWIAKHLPFLDVAICQTAGGALQTIAGNGKRAPVRRRLATAKFVAEVLASMCGVSSRASYALMEPCRH